MWAGIAGAVTNNGSTYEVAISIHDSVYSTDFSSHTMPYTPMDPQKTAIDIQKHVLDVLRKFSSEHLCKFLGAGVTVALLHEVRSWPLLIHSLSLHFFSPFFSEP
jgi:hypothetical protein